MTVEAARKDIGSSSEDLVGQFCRLWACPKRMHGLGRKREGK